MTNYEYHVTVIATDDEGYSTFPQVFVYDSLTEFLLAGQTTARFYDSFFEELSVDIQKVPVEEVEEDLAEWERELLGLDDEPERVYDDFWDPEPEPVASTSPKRSFFSKVFGRKSA